jgi:hypothetical protein
MVDEKDLEQRLRDLRPYLAYPLTPNLVVSVRTRLITAPPRHWWSSLAIPRRLAVAAAVALLVIGGLLAIPRTRDTIAHWFAVKGVIVNTVPSLPPGPLGGDLNLGQRTTLAGAQAGVRFQVLVPTDSSVGQPDEVYLNRAVPGGEVSFVYHTRPGLPTSSTTDVAILVMEIQGSVDKNFFGKMIGPGTTLTEVTVNGGPGYWIEGNPHVIFFKDALGNFHDENLRLASNTLVWQQGDVTLRIEGPLTKAQALQLAASMQ